MLRNYKLNTYEFLKYKEKKHVKEKQKKNSHSMDFKKLWLKTKYYFY